MEDRNMSFKAGNEKNLISNMCMSSPVEPNTTLKIHKRWKTTSLEDDLK